jgi:hypothetical protein
MDCWCACCGEFDCYGMDLCQSCGAPLDVYVSTPAPPTEWVLDAEVFGTARSDDGGTMHFVRSLKSAERLAALRSMPYPDYLETDEWFNVRMSALTPRAGAVKSAIPTRSSRSTTGRMTAAARKSSRTSRFYAGAATSGRTTPSSSCREEVRRRRGASGSSVAVVTKPARPRSRVRRRRS